MHLRPVTKKEVRYIIFEMKSTSAGSDSVNLLLFKTAYPVISDAFTSLTNDCFKQGRFSDCMKITRKPLFSRVVIRMISIWLGAFPSILRSILVIHNTAIRLFLWSFKP